MGHLSGGGSRATAGSEGSGFMQGDEAGDDDEGEEEVPSMDVKKHVHPKLRSSRTYEQWLGEYGPRHTRLVKERDREEEEEEEEGGGAAAAGGGNGEGLSTGGLSRGSDLILFFGCGMVVGTRR